MYRFRFLHPAWGKCRNRAHFNSVKVCNCEYYWNLGLYVKLVYIWNRKFFLIYVRRVDPSKQKFENVDFFQQPVVSVRY